MVRPARPEDTPRIFDLLLELAEYERLRDRVSGSAELLNEHLFGQPKYAECLVAEEGGLIVGYALFFSNYSTFLTRPGYYLEDIYVQPTARGKGYGKALLGEICRRAQEKGFGRVDWAVLDWNEPSIRFYESIGAVPMSDWVTYRLEGEALRAQAEAGHSKVLGSSS
jgi:GNAT superfamily N-acetyltransferase